MNNTARKGLSSIGVLSLLSLFAIVLAIAIGAQAALAAASSSTPAAGTQGRGGVSATSSTTFAATPAAGTQGRGGIAAGPSSALAGLDPAAGTQGRGGVASLPGSSTGAGRSTAAASGFSLRVRGGAARPVAGRFAAPSTTPQGTSFGVWIAAGLAAAALILGISAWGSTRRRRPQAAASRAEFCAQHPDDAMCMTA